jgi:hypothetical protein
MLEGMDPSDRFSSRQRGQPQAVVGAVEQSREPCADPGGISGIAELRAQTR